jgi:AcrR family transcriptional regulator
VLDAALLTFARFGYRKTSMEQVARDADISRPGLYFLFGSKQALFREAVERSLQQDLVAVEHALAGSADPFRQRLLHAFDHWAGRYIGPLTRDVATVVDDNPSVLGPMVTQAPHRFAQMITDAISTQRDRQSAEHVAQTLISTSIGIKHQVDDRQTYLERLETAIDLLLATPPAARGRPPNEAPLD